MATRARRALLPFSLAAALLGAGGALLGSGSCASPTAIRVDIYTELECDADPEVALTIAASTGGLAEAAPSTTSRGCVSAGRVGDVVIRPADEDDKPLAYAVATRQEAAPIEDCMLTPMPPDCIVARRQIRFSPHEELAMRVDLRLSCLGVSCLEYETCVKGQCVNSIVSAERCAGGCDEAALLESDPPDAGPDAPPDVTPQQNCDPVGTRLLAAGQVSAPRLVSVGGSFVATWSGPEPGPIYTIRGQEISPLDGAVGAPSDPLVTSMAPITEHLLGRDEAGNFGLVWHDTAVHFVKIDSTGAVVGAPSTIPLVGPLAAHGMHWGGAAFGFTAQDEGSATLYFTMVDLSGAVTQQDNIASQGSALVTAFDGGRFGLTWQDADSCFFKAFEGDGTVAVLPTPIAADCNVGHLSPRPDGWSFVYHSPGPAPLVMFARLDPGGNMVSGPVQVSPDDGAQYRHAQAVTTEGGSTMVFFEKVVNPMDQLLWVTVDDAGQVSTPAQLLPRLGVVAGQYEIAAVGERVGVTWFGRDEITSSTPDGNYYQVVCAPTAN